MPLAAAKRGSLGQRHRPLTQEFLAEMLGVRRTSVTEVASKVQNAGVITYSRGVIRILDRPALLRMSCECYETLAGPIGRAGLTSRRIATRSRLAFQLALLPVLVFGLAEALLTVLGASVLRTLPQGSADALASGIFFSKSW